MAARKAADKKEVSVPALNIQLLNFTLVGDTPLIVHAFSEKARKQILDKQMKQAKMKKDAKNPWLDFCNSLHWMSEKPEEPNEADVTAAKFGFPSIGIKAAAVDACSYADGVTKVAARGTFHIMEALLQIQGDGPFMREDMVRIAMGTADVRHRGEFRNWRIAVPLRYNADVLSAEQIINLFNIAGFAVGLGDWRAARDGQNGLFHVERGGAQ